VKSQIKKDFASDRLQRYTIKNWLKKQKTKLSVIKPKYLMYESEIRQNEKMELLFKKFDADGSGALDMDEIFELFQQNNVNIEKETIKTMFNNQQFTLENFKNLNNSPNALKCKF
jgi:hypothetical protein